MEVMLNLREHVSLGDLVAGDCFLSSNDHVLFQVVDLTKEDVFRDGAVLRSDMVYVNDVQTGMIGAFPKNMVVEVVRAVISEA